LFLAYVGPMDAWSMNETKKRISAKSVLLVVGIICIVLLAGLISTVIVYSSIIQDKNSSISSLNSRISTLNSSVTNLQDQLDFLQTQLGDLLNATAPSVSLEELSLNPSAWLNRTVVVEGNFTGPWPTNTVPGLVIPWLFTLSSDGTTVKVVWNGWSDEPYTPYWDSAKALILGNFTTATEYDVHPDGSVTTLQVSNVIEAEKVYLQY